MTLNEEVHKFIQKENLLAKDCKVLLAVSGGVDSMVMLHLLAGAGLNIAVASINYKLREQSDEEEELVRDFCLERSITHHGYAATSEEIADMTQGNLQAKARDIRYGFFNVLTEEYDYQCLMTAHHADDRIEGFMIYALRGTGIDGLTSLKSAKDKVLRPLLSYSKVQILDYAKAHNVPYLDDHTNHESKYDRNYIRNEILPVIARKFPDYQKTLGRTMDNLEVSQELLHYLVNDKLTAYMSQEGGHTIIKNWGEVRAMPHASGLLFYALQVYGYNMSDIKDLLQSVVTGAIFYSDSHEALLDRDRLIIRRKAIEHLEKISIKEIGRHQLSDEEWVVIEEDPELNSDGGKDVEYFDWDKMKFPLEIRGWQPGDKFYPIGMGGKSKKVKDYLKDEKLSLFDKQKIKVLVSEGKICWIIGKRMDERYKVKSQSKMIMKISWHTSK